jgi:hypothetical protein
MPFEKEGMLPFTEVQILDYAPVVAGVLGLKTGEEWIYIEATENIQKRLLSIFYCDKSEWLWVLSYNPSHFAFEKILKPDARKSREKYLIYTLNPPCNHIKQRTHVMDAVQTREIL